MTELDFLAQMDRPTASLEALAKRVAEQKRLLDEHQRDYDAATSALKSAASEAHIVGSGTMSLLDGRVEVQFKGMIGKLPSSAAERFQDAIDTGAVAVLRKLEIRKIVTDNPDTLAEVVKRIRESIGDHTFAQWFQYDAVLVPGAGAANSPEKRTACLRAGFTESLAVVVKR